MNFRFKYLICLHKSYLDKGLTLTNYFKYLIALFGVYSLAEKIDLKITIIIAILYPICCYLLGMYWFKSNFILAENEVGNIYNNFQREVRRKLCLTKRKKK